MTHADTIVALSSPAQAALRAIVRSSGPRAWAIIDAISMPGSPVLKHARLQRRTISLGDDLRFEVTLYPFRGPRSSTGEDVIEVHLPGSPFLVKALLQTLCSQGARQAEPGEFTARAFFNGKLDLTSAEGVASTIAASNRAELNAARQLLSGELARRLTPMMDELVRLLALIEVGIDFTEEDVSFITGDAVRQSLTEVDRSLAELIDQSPRIERLSHEPRIVLTGRPNAGKSTLLNALSGTQRAVVSDVPGTTRDALSARLPLRRGIVSLIDVAGIDLDTRDAIDEQMQAAALRQIEQADAVVLLIDSTDDRPAILLSREPDLRVYSKSDLLSDSDGNRLRESGPTDAISIDARHGHGLDVLRDRLDAIAFGRSDAGATLAINARHVDAIGQARASIARAALQLERGPEFVAFELRAAIDHLGGILGNVSPDDVLGRIFSSFCIGK